MKSISEDVFKYSLAPYLDPHSILAWSKLNRRSMKLWRQLEPMVWEYLDRTERSRELWWSPQQPNQGARDTYRQWKAERSLHSTVFTPKRTWFSFLYTSPYLSRIVMLGARGTGKTHLHEQLLKWGQAPPGTCTMQLYARDKRLCSLHKLDDFLVGPNIDLYTRGFQLVLMCYSGSDPATLEVLRELPHLNQPVGLVRIVDTLRPHQPTPEERAFVTALKPLWAVSVALNGDGMHHLAYRIASDIQPGKPHQVG